MHGRTCLAVLTLLVSWLVPCASRADALYTITALPAAFSPSDINNAGQMAGVVYAGSAGPHAAIYTDGAVTDLGAIGATWSFASAINEAGAVAGNFDTAAGASHAFLYLNGVMHDIGAANALGLNAAGDVVGQTYNAHGASGFLYHAGTMTEIGHLGTGITSLAAAINDSGQIVGESDTAAELHAPSHPYLYDHGTLVDLGTLAGREVNSAVVINNAGQVAGYSESANGGMHAFFYEDGVMTDLGSFGGLDVTIGGMNQLGQVVGTGNTWDGPDVPFISSNGALIDLNTLIDATVGWTITSALDINDHGQIIADACRAGQCSAVRLDLASAVPEPVTALLLLPGLLMLAGSRRCRRRQMDLPA